VRRVGGAAPYLALAVAAALFAAIASYFVVERPMLRRPARAAPVETAPVVLTPA
jgi:peptidoglycan/LPS O-acetylase OafA/YrhL